MNATTTAPIPSTDDPDAGSSATTEPSSGTASASIAFGAAGLLPVLPILGSIVAVVLGALALHEAGDAPTVRSRARVGLLLGIIGVVAPLIALIVYCWVLGYPFPIHRYDGSS